MIQEKINPTQSGRKSVLIMAGGTGGHIFPALAVAQALQKNDWQVSWVGGPQSMEAKVVPAAGLSFIELKFAGVRGKGWLAAFSLPWRLVRALVQGVGILRRVRPQVLIGFGGYMSLPIGLLARPMRNILFIHEQNSVAGSANKILARTAQRVFSTFANVLSRAEQVGNPLRLEFLKQEAPVSRFAERSGSLRLLVLGGSLGAKALNEALPKALALLEPEQRPLVLHQSGEKHLESLRLAYREAGVQAQTVAFIEDTASAMVDADVLICRAGASTVCEIAAVGAAALLIPFPHATDNHQSSNAEQLSSQGAAWKMEQSDCSPEKLAQWLLTLTRSTLLDVAQRAHAWAMPQATEKIVQACDEVAARTALGTGDRS